MLFGTFLIRTQVKVITYESVIIKNNLRMDKLKVFNVFNIRETQFIHSARGGGGLKIF